MFCCSSLFSTRNLRGPLVDSPEILPRARKHVQFYNAGPKPWGLPDKEKWGGNTLILARYRTLSTHFSSISRLTVANLSSLRPDQFFWPAMYNQEVHGSAHFWIGLFKCSHTVCVNYTSNSVTRLNCVIGRNVWQWKCMYVVSSRNSQTRTRLCLCWQWGSKLRSAAQCNISYHLP